MTKISFDVDFSKDPEQILKEIQERAKAEVEKRESKERNAAYLSKLHESVNEKIGTDFNSVSDLIRALTPFAAPGLRDKLSGTTATGRRKTISMNKTIFDEIKKLLTEPNPNKAAIARKTGVSVVQVRKVADGGFDSRYSESESLSKPNESSNAPSFAPPPIIKEEKSEPLDEEEATPPTAPSSKESENKIEDFTDSADDSDQISNEEAPAPSLPSFGDDEPALLPPPAPLDLGPSHPVEESPETDESDSDILPPLPKFTPAPFDASEEISESTEDEVSPPLPSFGDDEPSLPPPAPLDIAPTTAPSSDQSEETGENVDLLPPLPTFTPAPFDSNEDEIESPVNEVTPPLPSFGDEEPSLPPPAPSDISPPSPDLPPPAPISEEPQENEEPEAPTPPTLEDIPSAPPSPPPMVAKPSTGGLTRPPSGLKPTLKPKLSTGKKGKPTLSLKSKSKAPGLKITRPPMRGTPPPSQ
ncbi:MAG: hypothetical protein P8P49_11865 [Opitutales bacterium]|nr:hypothetical protein [Opitutales bacterium]